MPAKSIKIYKNLQQINIKYKNTLIVQQLQWGSEKKLPELAETIPCFLLAAFLVADRPQTRTGKTR